MQSRFSSRILLCAVGFSAALLALRLYTLLSALDPGGLLPRSSPVLPITAVLCAVCFAAICLLGLQLNRRPGSAACFPRSSGWRCIRLDAGCALSLGSLLSLLHGADLAGIEQAGHLLGLVCGAGMLVLALAAREGQGSFWPRALLTGYGLLALVIRFRDWSHEPLVIDIIPRLLALLCDMVCAMFLAGFPLKVGRRRSTVCFGLCAGIFTLMAVPDFLFRSIAVGEALIYLGFGCWCAVHALQLLADPETAAGTPPEAEDAAPDGAAAGTAEEAPAPVQEASAESQSQP